MCLFLITIVHIIFFYHQFIIKHGFILIKVCFLQVSVAAKNVLTKCSSAHGTLKDSETQLDDLLNSFEEIASRSGLSVKSQKKSWIDVQANKTRVTEARSTAMESLQAVENDCTKIKAAMLW